MAIQKFDRYTPEEKAQLKQYGDYMLSKGFTCRTDGINCWHYGYGEDNRTFWTVDLIDGRGFGPKIYKFEWLFDGEHEPELNPLRDGWRNAAFLPEDFEEFKECIDYTVAKFKEYDMYKKKLVENKRIQNMQSDF